MEPNGHHGRMKQYNLHARRCWNVLRIAKTAVSHVLHLKPPFPRTRLNLRAGLNTAILSAALATLPSFLSAFEYTISTDQFEEEIRGTALLTRLDDPDSDARAQDVVAAAQADYARVIGVLYDRGFFAPQVSIKINGQEAASLSLVRPISNVRTVVVRVQTGPRFRFGRARISPVPSQATLPEDFADGRVATTGTMKAAVESGINSWRSIGHAKAALAAQTIVARHNADELDADIRLAPGPKLRFGDLQVSGTKRMRTKRVKEIASLPTGKVFDPDEIDQARTRLRRTGVFSSIALSEAETISPDGTLDIEAQLTETKPRRFGFGAEFSTDDGFAFNGFWLHRNLFGGAERLRIGGEVSGLGGMTGGTDYELTLAFSRPATFNKDTDFYTNAVISSVDEPNFKSDRASLEAGITRYATPEREYSFGLGYAAANTTDAFGSRSYKILTAPLSATFDYRNDDLDATSGYYAKASLTPFANISGTANGLRGFFDARTYRSFGNDDRVTLALRGQLGFVAGPTLANAPTDFLFYSGGGGTVRGQDYQSLGVDLGGGKTTGGASFVGLSGEVRVKAGKKLGIVGFYDLGLVGSEPVPNSSNSEWHAGAGVGVRYDTGIGPIRLDVGMPIDQPLRAGNVKIYIGIGQSF